MKYTYSCIKAKLKRQYLLFPFAMLPIEVPSRMLWRIIKLQRAPCNDIKSGKSPQCGQCKYSQESAVKTFFIESVSIKRSRQRSQPQNKTSTFSEAIFSCHPFLPLLFPRGLSCVKEISCGRLPQGHRGHPPGSLFSITLNKNAACLIWLHRPTRKRQDLHDDGRQWLEAVLVSFLIKFGLCLRHR